MTPKPRKLSGGQGGAPGPRERRDLQRGTPVGFPLRKRGEQIEVLVDPTGAIGTDPAKGLFIRTGGGLGVETGSPYRLVVVLGEGLEVVDGKVRPRFSSSVKANAKKQLIATPSTMEVTDPDDGSAFAKLARKANIADVPFARGRVTLVSGAATVLDSDVASDSVVLVSHGTLSGVQGMLSTSISDGVGFGIASSSGTDAGVVHYAVWSA